MLPLSAIFFIGRTHRSAPTRYIPNGIPISPEIIKNYMEAETPAGISLSESGICALYVSVFGGGESFLPIARGAPSSAAVGDRS